MLAVRRHVLLVTLLGAALSSAGAAAQTPSVPADYQSVLTSLGRSGDFKDGVLKVNVPRNDLAVTIDGRPAPTPFGFGGWVAMTAGDGGVQVLMGDLVLTEAEVDRVMSALLDNGFDVTALHNHFFHEQPRIFYMHVHGMGSPSDLATRLKPALALIPQKPAAAVRRRRRRPLSTAGLVEDDWSGRGADGQRLQDHARAPRHRSP